MSKLSLAPIRNDCSQVAGFYLGIERGERNRAPRRERSQTCAGSCRSTSHARPRTAHFACGSTKQPPNTSATLELDPTSKVSRGSLADLYRASGKTEEALALYNEQLAADPKDKAARAGKVISLFRALDAATKRTALSKPHSLKNHATCRCSPAPPTGLLRTTTTRRLSSWLAKLSPSSRVTRGRRSRWPCVSRFEASARRRTRDALSRASTESFRR
jgi:tetratricopeptide (TPR) repeat protein